MARMIRCLRTLPLALAIVPLAAHAESVPVGPEQIRQVQVSSTAETPFEGRAMFEPHNLVDRKNWSAWGSRTADREGAWVRFRFDAVQYIDEVRFVAGNNRDQSFFKACGRPARLRFEAGGHVAEVDFRDLYEQTATFSPPLVGDALTVTVEAVHGQSTHGGVCLSSFDMRGPANPRGAVPGLTETIQRAIGELADDHRFPRGREVLVALGAPALPEVLIALDPGNPGLAARAAEVAGLLGDARAIPALAALADNPNPAIADAAKWSLGALHGTAHFDKLMTWYQQALGPRRDRAFDGLARLGDARALDVVMSELVDGTPARRQSAIDHLGRFGQDAVDALEPMMASTVLRERAAALRALGSVAHPQARELLLGGLLDARSELRSAAVEGLARRGDADAHDRIVSRWSSRYTEEREAVAAALGNFARADDLETLELLSSDSSMSVRVAATRSLGRLGPAAQGTLRTLALAGPDGATATVAAQALLRGEANANLERIIPLLASRHAEVRALVGRAVAAFGEAGYQHLIAAVIHGDDAVRGAAATELGTIGVRVLPDLLMAAGKAEGAALPELLALMTKFGDPMATPFAVEVAKNNPDLAVRTAAIRTMGGCGGPAATPALVAALDDPAVEVRRAAAEATGTLRIYQASFKLMALLDQPDPAVQRAAVRALGAIRQRTALEPLMARYRDSVADYHEADMRQDLVVAIGRIGGRDTLPLLVDATSDPDMKVRVAAIDALR